MNVSVGRSPARGRLHVIYWILNFIFVKLLYISVQAIHFEICNFWSEGLAYLETGMKSDHDARQGVFS